jgi:hypothetical protein
LGAWTPFSSAGVSGADGKAVFTASPFGQADILRPGSARIFKYKAAAFAGPCLMTPEIFDSLVKYVSGGGTLFIAGYNFLVSPDSEKLIFDGKISALTGLTVKDGGVVAPEGAARLPDKFHSFKKGAGTVIFGSFFDSRHDGARIKMIDDELRKIALEIRKRSGFVFSAADETAFSFNVWRGHGPSRIFITNIRAEDASGQETAFEFHVNGKKISGALPPAETAALAV